MQNAIIDLENEIKALRKKLKDRPEKEEVPEEDVERLKYVQEEIRSLLSE